jgi:spore germination cell wall hydrolase CwlJ-like protein
MTLLGEAEGEGKYGLRCVANVIYQRTKERKKTPAEICLQPHQFSCWTDNIPQVYKWDKKLKSKQGKEALRLARLVILGIDPLPTDDSNHFYSGNRVPYWAVGKSAKRIGNHVFVEL